jgi:hypothetical protein
MSENSRESTLGQSVTETELLVVVAITVSLLSNVGLRIGKVQQIVREVAVGDEVHVPEAQGTSVVRI